MTVAPDLIARIKDAALNLPIACEDTLFLDKLLGQVELLIHEARSEIDDEWRAARQRSAEHYRRPVSAPPPTLDDLA